jgi:uncharacterized protein
MDFTWDPKKSELNLKKHKVSFEEAVTVFYDPLAKTAHDPDHSNDEERFIIIGHSHKENTETIRIISARKATKKEKKDFEEL